MDIAKASAATRESTHLEFKEKFDPDQAEDWCDLIKHIVAIANSGGGIILIGVSNDGSASAQDVSAILGLDPARVTDKIAKYTGIQFDGFQISQAYRQGSKIAVLEVDGSSIPVVFVQPGTFATTDGKQKTAFSQGTVYFRHGAKSEPGCFDDLRKAFDRELRCVRRSWLGNVRQIVNAPFGSKIQYIAGDVVNQSRQVRNLSES